MEWRSNRPGGKPVDLAFTNHDGDWNVAMVGSWKEEHLETMIVFA